MSLNLNALYPELLTKQDHFFSDEQLQSMPYFRELSILLPQKDLLPSIRKCRKLFRLLSIKKGTIIYTSNTPSLSGYFLCHGAVTLLIKKNNRQKLQPFPKHILHLQQQRSQYLNQQLGIPLNLTEQVMSQFYEQKVLFRYIEYQKLYGQGYFGFGDMVKNGMRAFTIVATQDTILLEMDKDAFEVSLKELEIKKEEFIIDNILANVKAGEDSYSNHNQANSHNSNNTIKQLSSTITHSSSSSISQQLSVKFSHIFNFCTVKTFDKDEIIFTQNQSIHAIYFILQGEIQLTKSFSMPIPKKLIKDENKPQIPKEVSIKVSRLSQKSYLGETEFFLHTKHRQFAATSTSTHTILLQIQPYLFMKIIGEFTPLQKDLIVSAKQKFSIAQQNYLKQKNKAVKLFMQEFQIIQNKKKQKIITNLLLDDQAHPKGGIATQGTSMMFEVFSKEGMFFRDTYQRLQGFEQFNQSQANNKRAAIRKYKVDGTPQKYSIHTEDKQPPNLDQSKYQTINSFHQRNQQDFHQAYDSKQKLIYSPKRNINILQLMSSEAPPQPRKQASTSLTDKNTKIKRKKSFGKFHQLQKDQAVFKRVLIKNGRFEQDKTTCKTNIVKPLVHPKFDDIIKQCMSRKNQVIRRAIGEKRNDFVKDTYQNTVESLKNMSLSISKFSSVGLTCKGTEEFKKKLQMFSKQQKKSDPSGIRNRVAIEEQNLKDCIGFNEPPKSSHLKSRYDQKDILLNESNIKNSTTSKRINSGQKVMRSVASSSHIGFGQRATTQWESTARKSGSGWIGKRSSPEKLVLLNHMMKPITYSSVEY